MSSSSSSSSSSSFLLLFFFSPSPGGSLPTSTRLCLWIRLRATTNCSDSWRRTSVRWRATIRSPSSQTGESSDLQRSLRRRRFKSDPTTHTQQHTPNNTRAPHTCVYVRPAPKCCSTHWDHKPWLIVSLPLWPRLNYLIDWWMNCIAIWNEL